MINEMSAGWEHSSNAYSTMLSSLNNVVNDIHNDVTTVG
jgi:hypothetical protein